MGQEIRLKLIKTPVVKDMLLQDASDLKDAIERRHPWKEFGYPGEAAAKAWLGCGNATGW